MPGHFRILGFLLLLSSSLTTTAQSDPKLHISHLTGDFYVYTTYKILNGSPFPSNSMYLVTTKGVVLFDTPWDTTQFQPLLDSIQQRHSKPVILCLATHYHDDRTAGLAFFKSKGIETWSSLQTKQLCRQHKEAEASRVFTTDTIFSIGNHKFSTYYPGKGHTADNIVVWFEKERVLYGGCLVKSTESRGLGNVADADVEQWPLTINRLIKRFPSPAYVIPGHFDWSDRHSLQHTLQLLQDAANK
jgi:glyoxylase-like metal-dependent hydrolase (beta-lactamase superfamily II)